MRTPEETLELRKRFVPRHGLAAGSGSAAPRASRRASRPGTSSSSKPDVKSIDGPVGADATSRICTPGRRCICLARAGSASIRPRACSPAKDTFRSRARRNPASAAPVTGAVDEGEVDFGHEMTVDALPRNAAGDEALHRRRLAARSRCSGTPSTRSSNAGDVRLTMGGEPTFVSIDDPDGDEWNVRRARRHKRERAGDLLATPRGAASRPGACSISGRASGTRASRCHAGLCRASGARTASPIWENPALIADDTISGRSLPEDIAERFAHGARATALNVNPRYATPAYEDHFYYLWRERRLARQREPSLLEARRRDGARSHRPRVRAGARAHRRAMRCPSSPRSRVSERFRSGLLFKRSEPLFLVPGDSPMGYRLPLGSLPWVEPGERTPHIERDPFEERSAAAGAGATAHVLQNPRKRTRGAAVHARIRAVGASRTALCTEVREGRLHVFMPPIAWLEDYLAVVQRRRRHGAELNQPVLVEGYPPPHDSRAAHPFSVTPDPGVIEVNVHPSSSWTDLVDRTDRALRRGAPARLGTEKFMLDGRHTGTGGGNHVTLGGDTPGDSPFLRRPDLLRSMVGYWHDHPSLSYLFSGLFIGPTSQAPRVGRSARTSRPTSSRSPSARSTTRRSAARRRRRGSSIGLSAICSPTSPATRTARSSASTSSILRTVRPGASGCVEMRGFEMPPHARMSLAQQLLVRGAAWRRSGRSRTTHGYRAGVRRSTTGSCLPHFVAQDFADVIRDLNCAGFPFDQGVVRCTPRVPVPEPRQP